ncbi:MAG: hypothetical protein HY929_03490 [Euryarchaeota archaeon]|nr:hypothetical protein [Euryarchaeota archaeon]
MSAIALIGGIAVILGEIAVTRKPAPLTPTLPTQTHAPVIKFCSFCGARMANIDAFCPSCGQYSKKIEKTKKAAID